MLVFIYKFCKQLSVNFSLLGDFINKKIKKGRGCNKNIKGGMLLAIYKAGRGTSDKLLNNTRR